MGAAITHGYVRVCLLMKCQRNMQAGITCAGRDASCCSFLNNEGLHRCLRHFFMFDVIVVMLARDFLKVVMLHVLFEVGHFLTSDTFS